MPKDSDLLPPHSLALLRAARSGRLRKRPTPADEDDADADALPGDKIEKKASAMDEGFRVLVWKQVPRSEEGPTISHLAKRQKGTITLPSKALATQTAGPTITKATVRRIDAAGNPYTQEVTVNDGQQVDGEIISTNVVPAPEQTGLAPPAAATPTRRKPPIPQKKKGRGRGARGRGRGRTLPLQATARPGPQDGPGVDGATGIKNEGVGPDVSICVFLWVNNKVADTRQGIKIEGEDSKAGQDVEMRDSSAVDEDGEEGEGDGDADDGDDDDGDESGTPAENEDQEMDDAPALTDANFPSTAAADVSGATPNLAPPTPNLLNTDTSRIEGSPLKNVLIRSPTDVSPHVPPLAAPISTDAGSSGVPDEPTLGLQSSPMTSQLQRVPVPDVSDETPAEELKPAEVITLEKTIQETPIPETPVTSEVPISETAVPEMVVPETSAPEMAAPESAATEMAAPETTAPQTTAPQTTAPEMTAPETTAPETATPETAVPETAAPESSELAPEETTGFVAITSSQQSEEPVVPLPDPPVVLPAAIEQLPPVKDAPQAEASTADIPIPTSEDPKTGEAPEADTAVPKTEPPVAESVPTELLTSGPVKDPVPVESALVTQAMTEDGTDDGSDLLGPLGASLSRQAEEDVPPPTSAPANPQIEQLGPLEEAVERKADTE